MIDTTGGKLIALFLWVALVGSVGCGSSKPSRFYTLASMNSPGSTFGNAPARPGAVVAIGPVTIPRYLDRPQIVTRSDGNEVRIAETERWAGSLEEDVSRVLIENLSMLLAEEDVVVLRWKQAVLSPVPIKCRVEVEVMRFEGTVGGTVELAARYTIHDVDGKALSMRESTLREPAGGPGYGSLAAAMSRTLASASREIASVIRDQLWDHQRQP